MNRVYAFLRKQPWLYDRAHDSMCAGYRYVAHVVLRAATRVVRLKYLVAPPFAVGDRLNLGSGRNPLAGWINADINPFSRAELWIDLRDRWPIGDGIVSVVYSRHCMEHFNEKDLSAILHQSHRILQPGGAVRIGVPSLETAVQQYLRKDFAFAGWLDQTQPQAKLFIRYITDNGNHPILLDFEYLSRLLSDAGFVNVTRCAGGVSKHVDSASLAPGDCAADSSTLYVEATKS